MAFHGRLRQYFSAILTCMVLLGLALGLTAILETCTRPQFGRKQPKTGDCRNNLKQLGLYVNLYVSKYGSGTSFPPAPSYNFLDTLRSVPTESTAIAAGAHGLFVCKVRGTMSGKGACDYRMPNYEVTLATPPGMPLLCDRPDNHDASGAVGIHVLLFDGSLHTAMPGSVLYESALANTKE